MWNKLQRKQVVSIICIILAAFIIFNIVWYSWRNIKYAQYSDGMPENSFSNVIVPRYSFTDNEGYDFHVKYPDYLSFTGNLTVGMPTDEEQFITDAIIIWPLVNGNNQYGLMLYDESGSYEIYVDEEGNALDSVFDEVIQRHWENVNSLLEKADEIWNIFQ